MNPLITREELELLLGGTDLEAARPLRACLAGATVGPRFGPQAAAELPAGNMQYTGGEDNRALSPKTC